MTDELDRVILVNEHNEVQGELDKKEAHRHSARLHRAVSVWLFRKNHHDREDKEKIEVLIQKRSAQKITGSGWWANTICGNVRPNEDFTACAVRRLREEVGINSVQLKPWFHFTYQAYCNQEYGEAEWDEVFMGWYDGPVVPQPQEVQSVAWVDLAVLVNAALQQQYLDPAQTLNYYTQDLKELTPPMTVSVPRFGSTGATEVLQIAPWTVLMLRMSNLRDFA